MIFVVEITVAVDDVGTEQTFRFSSGLGWATGPADTPAHTYIASGMRRSGGYRRSMFADRGMFGAVRVSHGTIEIANGDGSLDAWRTYGYGRRVRVYWGAEEGLAYPGAYTLLFEARVAYAEVTTSVVRLVLRDGMEALDRPVCRSTLAGTGGLQGPSTMAGRIIPRTYGDTFHVPAVLVDEARQIWLVCENQVAAVGQVAMDAGVAVPLGSHYADTATLLSTAPAAGQARWYVGGPTYVRFETAPASVQVSPGEAKVAGGGSPTLASIALEAGMTSASGTAVTPEIYVDDARTTYLEVLAREARQRPMWFGADRTGAFVAQLIEDPVGGSPVATLSHWDVMTVSRTVPRGLEAPVWRVNVRGRRNYAHGQSLSADAPAYVREPYYKAAEASDAGVLAKHPGAGELAFEAGGFTIGGAAEWLALHGADRDYLRVAALMDDQNVTYDLGDVLTLKHPRFGLGAGRNYAVCAVDVRYSGTIEWGLWG